MKLARICIAVLVTLTFTSIAAAQCGPARPKTTAAAGSLDEMIIAQEQAIINALKKGDAEAFKALVDVNGTAVDANGIKKISETLPMLFDPKIKFSEFSLEDPQIRSVDKNTAIINYKSTATATMNGKTESWTSFETTLFVRRTGKWIAVFHQSSVMAPQAPTAVAK